MAAGVIRPTCDFTPLHESLVKQEIARLFQRTYAAYDPGVS